MKWLSSYQCVPIICTRVNMSEALWNSYQQRFCYHLLGIEFPSWSALCCTGCHHHHHNEVLMVKSWWWQRVKFLRVKHWFVTKNPICGVVCPHLPLSTCFLLVIHKLCTRSTWVVANPTVVNMSLAQALIPRYSSLGSRSVSDSPP